MHVHMEPDERALFTKLLSQASSYTEFGSGGSTVLAASLLSGAVTSVDSSKEWLARVETACGQVSVRSPPRFVFADIGPTVEWGQPADDSCRNRWPLYGLSAWEVDGAENADMFLVDGRFRVACFLETLLRCREEAKIAIHDYAPRPGYHVVEPFVDCIAAAGTLSVFRRRPSVDWRGAVRLLDRARYDRG